MNAPGERQAGDEREAAPRAAQGRAADLLADALLAAAVEHDLGRHARAEGAGIGLEVARLAALDDQLEVGEARPGGCCAVPSIASPSLANVRLRRRSAPPDPLLA